MTPSFRKTFYELTGKAHVYPPLDLYTPLQMDTVLQAWQDFAQTDTQAPMGIYVHLPFCARKCSFCYCDTVISDNGETHDHYIEALIKEMALFGPALSPRPIDTVYLGGGTPTYVGAPRLRAVLEALQTHFLFSAQTHLNIEATPGSITPEIAALLGEFHTDRVTLGIQSLDEHILSEMNRPQTLPQIEAAVSRLREHGIAHLNFDLVGGLPQDTVASFQQHFEALLELQPEMVHVYPYSSRPSLSESPEKDAILQRAREIVEDRGYRSIKNDGWGKSEASANLQVKDKIERAGSCLGLGVRARSHVFGRLAYRTVSGRDYEAQLRTGTPPQYHGTVLKLRHQVQRFLIDNLRQGVSTAQFKKLFKGEVLPFVQRYAPDLVPMLETRDGEVRCTHNIQSDREVQIQLFDPALKRRLYLQHIDQPRGWPVPLMTPEALGREPDWNWLHFLAKELTKGNTYPPITSNQRVQEQDVHEAWAQYAQAVKQDNASPVAGIYCHIPFCATKCKFCYCFSIQLDDKTRMERYVRALQRQIEGIAPHTRDLHFKTLYFGGGTPSLLPPHLLDELLQTLHAHFRFHDDFQFNFEGTPQTLGIEGRIPILARHGVTRLTIGIQSLENHLLHHMDRAQQSRVRVGEVIQEARAHGVKTINVDVMAGLPDQSFEDFKQTFEEVLSWRPEVLHPYPFQNTTETRYYQEGFRTDDRVSSVRREMMEYAHRRLREADYQEVPNESWCLGIEHRNQQDVDKIISSCSVLPLGYVARGHVFGSLTYGTIAEGFEAFMEDPSQAEFYYGHKTAPQDEQVRYIISNLRSGFSRVDYEATFGMDCLENFWWQFSILEKLGKVRITSLEVQSRMDSSLDSVLYSKLFFDEAYHSWLREFMADRYDSSVDYIGALERHYERSF